MTGDPETPEARLVDIVVEEVSLVDQAANKRQFLVIKRARSGMSKTNTSEDTNPKTDDAMLAALERVGKAVAEAADEIDDPSDVARLVLIAEQLNELVQSVLEEGDEDEEEEATTPDASKGTADAPAPAPEGTPAEVPPAASADKASVASAFARIEALLVALRGKARTPPTPVAPATPPAPAAAPASPPAVDPLAKVLAAISDLSGDIKAQGQRLGRLEKGVGLPSSQRTSERASRDVDEEDVSWPMDLNAPVARSSVDKGVSFHDD